MATKYVYSVSFEYRDREGQWRWSYDHRCKAVDEESAIRQWRSAGYGEIRNAKATLIVP